MTSAHWACCCDDPKGPVPCPKIAECLSLPGSFRVTITEVIWWIRDIAIRDYYRAELVQHLIHRPIPNVCGWVWQGHDIFIRSVLDEKCNFAGFLDGQWSTELSCDRGFWQLNFTPGFGIVCFEMANVNNSPLGTYTAVNTGAGGCRSFNTGNECESEGSVVLSSA